MSGKKQNNVVPTALWGIIGEIFYQNAVPNGTNSGRYYSRRYYQQKVNPCRGDIIQNVYF
jgi:hypothetical protein